jgi:hypothetical protein
MNDAPGRGGFGYGRGGRARGFRGGGLGGVGRGGRRRREYLPLAQPDDQSAARPASLQALEERLQRMQSELTAMGDQIRNLVMNRREEEEEQ